MCKLIKFIDVSQQEFMLPPQGTQVCEGLGTKGISRCTQGLLLLALLTWSLLCLSLKLYETKAVGWRMVFADCRKCRMTLNQR